MAGGGANLNNIKATDQNAYGSGSFDYGATTYPASIDNQAGGNNDMRNLVSGFYPQQPQQAPVDMGPFVLPGPNTQQTTQAPSANDTITGYYKNILQRAPDQAGIDYWNKQAQGGMSLDEIKQNFLKSPEYMGSAADQQGYAKYLQSLSAPQQMTMAPQQPAAPRQPAPPVWKPTTAGVGNQPQTPVFNNNPIVTQSGGAGSGGAMNFQYRRGGIASLLKR